MRKIYILFVFTFFLSYSFFYGQDKKIDSAKLFLKSQPQDTAKVKALNFLGKSYEFIDQKIAWSYLEEAMKLSKKINFENGIATSYTYMGYLAEDASLFDSAVACYTKSYAIYLKLGNKMHQADQLKMLGETSRYQGDLKKSLNYFLRSLTLYEEIDSKWGVANAYYSLGGLYQDLKRYDRAMEAYQKSLDINNQLGNTIDMANAITAVGIIHNYKKNYAEANKNYFEAKKIYEELNYDNGLSNCLTWIAITAYNEKNIPKALDYFMQSLKLYEKINSINGIMYTYNNIGSIYTELGKHELAIEWEKKSLEMAKKSKGLQYQRYSYETLAHSYAKMGDFKNAFESHQLYMKFKDSILNETTTNQIAEMDKKFESVKKDKEIVIKNAALLKQTAEIDKQTTQRNYFIFGFVIMLLLAIFIFRGYRQKQKANEIIASQKHEVEKQKELIEEKQKEIVDSITYAKRLQQAILPPLHFVKNYFPESFILFKPKDIVAGDFYWMETIGETVYIAAADCTGHGVPGAMVSVVCSNALNRTVKEFKVKDPGKILENVRDLVIETFQKSENEVKDGMDISLCAIDLKNNSMLWAGANNPLWIIRNVSSSGPDSYRDENNLIEYKPNKQPIGNIDLQKPFDTHIIELQKNDSLYLFTDGYADQFGGSKGKKFKYKQLQELLIEINAKAMHEQELILSNKMDLWKGGLEQVDDILVIGIKIEA